MVSAMKLLLVEDDPALRTTLLRSLTRLGWRVQVCADGDTALDQWRTSEPDVVLLDLSLPGLDGLQVLTQARHSGLRTPVLILTARGTVGDRVLGLNAGADDYLPKPFDLDELEARVRALHRRHTDPGTESSAGLHQSGRLSYDAANGAIYHRGRVLELSPRELAALRALRAPVNSISDIPSAMQSRQQELRDGIMEPVLVAWDGKLETISLRRPAETRTVGAECMLEDGSGFDVRPVGAEKGPQVSLQIDRTLPPGYHHLLVRAGNHTPNSLIISAPKRAYLAAGFNARWGVFMPLYALRSREGWGAGSYTDLGRLTGWVKERGGSAIGTLPLLAAFLDKPFEAGPYRPASRLFWNELYIDVTAAPEYAVCESAACESAACECARAVAMSPAFQDAIARQRRRQFVDYRGVMALKRRVLEEMARHFFSVESAHRREFDEFTKKRPEVELYARFRAALEKQGKPWPRWPAGQRDSEIDPGDSGIDASNYHLYVQWLAEEQLRLAAAHGGDGMLYLDLPLGTHPYGYDTWRYRDVFINGASTGAPPDTVFTRGQDWTFPPLHPDAIRDTGYEYVIASLRHSMRHAAMLRIDHVMGFHRLYMIPRNVEPSQGVYVRYHPEEMYAIVNLESHRNRCVVVGEDLGIVPREVRSSMSRHSLQRMYVMYYELAADSPRLLSPPRPQTVASLATHDMPPFAAFWSGQDIAERRKYGVISAATAREERARRRVVKERLIEFLREQGLLKGKADAVTVLQACLVYLASSPSRFVTVNLEDLWLETHTQNIPSTTKEHPNWRFKTRYDLETLCQMPAVMSILSYVNRLREDRGKRGARKTPQGGNTRIQSPD